MTPIRRVILAWGLILVALLCQFTRESSVTKFFVLCVAVLLHGQLIPRVRPAERAVYIFYAVAIPFLVLEIINDIRYVRAAGKGSDPALIARE